jgi:hypothetical protein
MPWYSIQQDGQDLHSVFVMTAHDLDNQLKDGQTAVEIESPLIVPPINTPATD